MSSYEAVNGVAPRRNRAACLLFIPALLLSSFVLLSGGAVQPAMSAPSGYDPLRVTAAAAERSELVWKDDTRERELPLRIYLPKTQQPAPVVLFSHGLGGSRAGSEYLGNHWASRGYVAVFLQHPGSDEGVWKGRPIGERMNALRQAASPENFQLRVRDVSAVLDGLARWNETKGQTLHHRLDLQHVGMSGHSFGAVTTQAVSGQCFLGRPRFTDARIKAAVMMSPSGPRRQADPGIVFGQVKIPWMLLTGTQDRSPIGDPDPELRRVVFPALPPGGKYELVLAGAEHSAFTETRLPGETGRRNPNHHRAVLAVTTAFWDAYLRGDAEAKRWLDGDTVRGVLEKDDLWQAK